MGIDLRDGYRDLLRHHGHHIVCVGYGDGEVTPFENMAIECETCSEILVDFDIPDTFDIEDSWIDKHSVNCIKCAILFDERYGMTPEDGEGTLCPVCFDKEEGE